MKIVVTGTRGIPNIMGGVETHCEELFPRMVERGYDVTLIRRSNYVKDDLHEWKGVKLVTIPSPKKKSFEAIIHTFRAINEAKKLGADVLHIHAIGPALLVPYAKLLGMKVVFTHHGPDYDRDKWGFAAKTILKMGERMGCMFADMSSSSRMSSRTSLPVNMEGRRMYTLYIMVFLSLKSATILNISRNWG